MPDSRYPFVWTSPTGQACHLSHCGFGGDLTFLASWEAPCHRCRDEWDSWVRSLGRTLIDGDYQPGLLLSLLERETKGRGEEERVQKRAMTLVAALVAQAATRVAVAA